ncbi:MAG: hypothetical protein RBU29_14480 [bacterium]|jgi:hypothetical protein|nr:hypothetical protein [bacterium]
MHRHLIICLLCGLLYPTASHAQINAPHGEYRPTAKISHPRLDELSGITRADQPGQYWVHNDSEDTVLYRINDQGDCLQTVLLEGVVSLDWEGMTADPEGHLYIGEMGDNNAIRPFYSIHKFPRPTADQQTVDTIETCFFTYADRQSHNCEAIFFFQNKIYLITRTDDPFQKPKIFKIDTFLPKTSVVANEVGEMEVQGLVSDAAYSAVHNQLAVLTYHGVYFFPFIEEADLLKPPSHFIHSVMGWTEAVCYDDETLVIADEPGYLFKKPLDFWVSHDTFLPATPPRLQLSRTTTDPVLDGDLSDWQDSTRVSMRLETYSKYQGTPETSLPDPDIHLMWTAKGLYLGFHFSYPDVLPNFIDRLMLMVTPEPDALFLRDEMPIIMIFKEQTKDTSAWRIDLVRDKKSVGQVRSQSNDQTTTVEALIESQHLPAFEEGNTLRFNLVKFERNRQTRRSVVSYWATRASFIQSHPDLWGYLELVP